MGRSPCNGGNGAGVERRGRRKMRLRTLFPVVIVLLVAAVVAVMVLGNGCGFVSGKLFRRGNVAVAAMKQVPRGATEFSYWSIKEVAGEDITLHGIYDRFTPSAGVIQLGKLHIERSRIQYAAKAVYEANGSREIVLLGVDYNMDSLKDDLAGLNWDSAVYQGVDIWTPPDGGQDRQPMALKKGVIMMATVQDLEASIDAEKDKGVLDLYEDPAMKRVADNLPAGLITLVSIKTGNSIPDALANGASYQKGRTGTIKVTAIYSFEDTPAAEKSKARVEQELQEAGFDDIKAVRKESLVQATGVISISDFVDDLEW